MAFIEPIFTELSTTQYISVANYQVASKAKEKFRTRRRNFFHVRKLNMSTIAHSFTKLITAKYT